MFTDKRDIPVRQISCFNKGDFITVNPNQLLSRPPYFSQNLSLKV